MDGLFLLIAFIAEVIGTIVGFGSSTIALPLALFFFDFRTTLILIAFLHIFGNIGRISFFRHGLDKRILLAFGLPTVVLTLIGALLVLYIEQNILKGLLGAFLLIYAILSLWKEDLKVKSSLINSIVGGGISGFLAGLIGTGGVLRGAFLTSFGIPKERYIATAASIALAVDITRIPVYFFQGFLESKFYWYIPVLFVIAITGSFIGRQIVNKIPQKQFKKLLIPKLFLMNYFLMCFSICTTQQQSINKVQI